MPVVSILEDSTLGLDLERIREKIITLYNTLLTQAYKSENPAASPEELQAFLEENALDFPETEDSSEEIDSLLDMIDDLTKEDDLDPVAKDGEEPKVEQGKEPKSKSHENGDIPNTQPIPIQTGMLNTPPDKRKKEQTKKAPDPTGSQKHSRTRERPSFNSKSIMSIFDAEREKLLRLVEARNKEFGVVL